MEQLSPLILVPNSRCRIRLHNLEFRKIYRDFSKKIKTPTIFYGLEVFFWGSLTGLFFYLCFAYDCNVFFSLWSSSNEMSFVVVEVFALQCALKLSFLLVLTANFGDVIKLFIVTYFLKRKSGRLFVKLFSTYFKVIICH